MAWTVRTSHCGLLMWVTGVGGCYGGRDWFQVLVSAVGILGVTGSDVGRDSTYHLSVRESPSSVLECTDSKSVSIIIGLSGNIKALV